MPLAALKDGFAFEGRRISFGSFYSGMFRPKELRGPSALALVTAPPKTGKPAPYEDTYDERTGRFTYRFRDPGSESPQAVLLAAADNQKLIEAHRRGVPVIYFRGIAPGQYTPIAPVFVTAIDVGMRTAALEVGLPLADTSPEGLVSNEDTRRYATREAAYRLHQHRFRRAVLQAYRTRCTICSLKEASLLQAAHIVEDRDPLGGATVVNGLALCAIHHLAYDRNLLGIDPDCVVRIHDLQPVRAVDRPDRDRLAIRFEAFRAA